jgi:hypothetical protein
MRKALCLRDKRSSLKKLDKAFRIARVWQCRGREEHLKRTEEVIEASVLSKVKDLIAGHSCGQGDAQHQDWGRVLVPRRAGFNLDKREMFRHSPLENEPQSYYVWEPVFGQISDVRQDAFAKDRRNARAQLFIISRLE